jgi:hypothetical protein
MWRRIYHELQRWAKASRSAWSTYRRTEITVQTRERWIIHRTHSAWGWCPECGCEVELVSPADAMQLVGFLEPQLPDRPPARSWHWTVNAQGLPLVCVSSVVQRRQN